MKLNLPTLKPRNPFVAACMRRVAGSHRPGRAASRQLAKKSLRQELERLRPSP
jgi:hypothetical protein